MQDNEVPLPFKLQWGGGVYGRAFRAIVFVAIQSIVLLGVISLFLSGLYDRLPALDGHAAPLSHIGEYYLSVFTSALYSAFEVFSGSQGYSMRVSASIVVVTSLGLVNASLHEKFFNREKYNHALIKCSAALGYPKAVYFSSFADLSAQMATTMWSSREWDDDYWSDYLEHAQKYSTDNALDLDVRKYCQSFKDDHVPLTLVLLGHYKTALTVVLFAAPFLFWMLGMASTV